jgi:membrane dipeptidase
MSDVTLIDSEVQKLLRNGIVWENHACMPLRPGDTSFLPQLERVRASGINVISLNVSFDVVDSNDAFKVLATFRHWVRQHPGRYVLADSVADIEAAKASGHLAVIFDIEGGNAVAAHPGLVEIFYRLGVRWMLFAYNKNNTLGGGCMDDDTGLTAYGRQIIDELERVGMVLCCTHVGHRTAREAMEYCRNPVIFSHSNPSAVYAHARNIPDDLMVACAKSGGVVNINGVGIFLGNGPKGMGDASTETLLRHILRRSIDRSSACGPGPRLCVRRQRTRGIHQEQPGEISGHLRGRAPMCRSNRSAFPLSRNGCSKWATAIRTCRESWGRTICAWRAKSGANASAARGGLGRSGGWRRCWVRWLLPLLVHARYPDGNDTQQFNAPPAAAAVFGIEGSANLRVLSLWWAISNSRAAPAGVAFDFNNNE